MIFENGGGPEACIHIEGRSGHVQLEHSTLTEDGKEFPVSCVAVPSNKERGTEITFPDSILG